MIFVVEIPHQRPATAIAYCDEVDFVNRVTRAHQLSRSGSVLWEQTTPRALADNFGEEDLPEEVKRIAEESGWEVPLYRSDYVSSSGLYQTAPITEKEACVAFLAEDLHALHVYETPEDAIRGLDVPGHQSGYAHTALREVLANEGVIPDVGDILDVMQAMGKDPSMGEVDRVWQRLCGDTEVLLRIAGVKTVEEVNPAIQKEIENFPEMGCEVALVSSETDALVQGRAPREHTDVHFPDGP